MIIIFGVHRYKVDYDGFAIPELKSGIANVCLDDYHNLTAAGTAVDSATCNGRPSQNWQVIGDHIKHTGSCLTAPGNTISNNDKLVADTCGNQPGQVWLSSSLGNYENQSSGLCLSIPNGHVNRQLVVAACNDLTGSNETWAVSTWSKSNTTAAKVNCGFHSEGQQVACVAAKQWIAWQSGKPSHASLLNSYSDGNGYEEWCADFVSYVYQQSGHPLSGGERDNWDEYLANYIRYDGNFTYHSANNYMPKAGDVAYFDYPGGHVEIVAVGGVKPIFVYGDSGQTDPITGNGNMAENTITNDGSVGQVIYYLSPS